MKSSLLHHHLWLLSILSHVLSQDLAHQSISIWTGPDIINLRVCAQPCFSGDWGVYGFLSCDENNCLCRPDLSSSALSYVSSCIGYLCSLDGDTTDIAMGTSYYDEYCSVYSEEVPATAVAAPTTITAQVTVGSIASPSAVIVTNTVTRTGYTVTEPTSDYYSSSPATSCEFMSTRILLSLLLVHAAWLLWL